MQSGAFHRKSLLVLAATLLGMAFGICTALFGVIAGLGGLLDRIPHPFTRSHDTFLAAWTCNPAAVTTIGGVRLLPDHRLRRHRE